MLLTTSLNSSLIFKDWASEVKDKFLPTPRSTLWPSFATLIPLVTELTHPDDDITVVV